jgi:uncharacterized protein YgbK (DUF1537 family)
MRFLHRTAASFVATRAALEPRPLLSQADIKELVQSSEGHEINFKSRGGLVVVGSYVPKSTLQLRHLLTHAGAAAKKIGRKGRVAPPI